MIDELTSLSFVHIYDEGTGRTLDVKAIAGYIEGNLPSGVAVDVREEFFTWHLSRTAGTEKVGRGMPRLYDVLAEELASIKVRNPGERNLSIEPMYGEIEYERRGLRNVSSKPAGILYDGFRLSSILYTLIPEEETGLDHIHIVFTHQLFGTWDENNARYHARVSVYGFPSIISTTGVVEAPAKPKEFYLLKQQYAAVGMSDAVLLDLKQRFKGRFIDYDDERLTEVMKGYVMQAIFYHLTGDPFCDDRNCRLYNAHWQEELINAQLESEYEFCAYHEEALKRLNSYT